jgi:hypothetical protein
LLTVALPLIDRIVSLRATAMIHAATVSYKGRGICLPASGGTGKTSTIAKLLRIDGMAFMGDDWAFLSEDGRQLGYAKPIFIKPHHRPIYPHLFARRRKPLVPSSLTEPLARFATWVHPMVANYPSLARFLRHWSPEHMMVTPREAFPHAEIATEAVLGVAMFVERCDGDQVILRERDTAWMVSRMIGNFFYEIPPHSQQVVTALGASGLVPLDDLFARKATVLRQALGAVPTFHLQVPASWPPDQASDAIVEHIKRIFPIG